MIKIEHNLMYLNEKIAIMSKDGKYYLYDTEKDAIITVFDELMDLSKIDNSLTYGVNVSGSYCDVTIEDLLTGKMNFNGQLLTNPSLSNHSKSFALKGSELGIYIAEAKNYLVDLASKKQNGYNSLSKKDL
jgi:hypothetical protein